MTQARYWGNAGEEAVMRWLCLQGYRIHASNVRCAWGEIDIIAQLDDVLVCIEVKMRHRDTVPLACLVPVRKQRKIIKTARWYLHRQALEDSIVRFDVALVTLDKGKWSITYLPDAFQE